MTEKLYYRDAYATKFTARVLDCTEEKKHWTVILDRTLFYPEGGGQPADIGVLSGVCVLDVHERGEDIVHTTDKPLSVGAEVEGEIDWEHRFDLMQNHSGEHILSGVICGRYGCDNVGFHMGKESITIDLNTKIPAEDLPYLEEKANEAIWKNVPVGIRYPSKEELAKLEYRSKKELEGQVRIVTIPGVDVCACCAPHVKKTGEIGMLNVQSLSNYKGGVRISILSGFRALEEERKKSQVISSISGTLSANQELLPELVEKLKQSNQDLKYKLAQAKQKLVEQKMKEIPADQENVLLFETDLDTPVMRNAINGLVETHAGICGIFVEKEEGGYNFIIGSKTKDCREIATLLREKTGARGGGSAAMIQGSVSAEEKDLRELLA